MSEVFGVANFVSLITFAKTSSATSQLLPSICDYIIWYAKNRPQVRYHQMFLPKAVEGEGASAYTRVELPDRRRMSVEEAIRQDEDLTRAKYYRLSDLRSQRPPGDFPVEFE